MKDFAGKTAVITGAGSGFGREFARIGASLGMKLVLADIQQDALDAIAKELAASAPLAMRVDVSKETDMAALADAAFDQFGAVHLLFNNAGVATGGLVWEQTLSDWHWVLGVNLWSVIYGVKFFTPRMLAQNEAGHIINTASVAGLLSPKRLGIYCVSKHSVVTLSETLYQDLRSMNAKIGVTCLCPAFVPTGIAESERNRPADLSGPNNAPTPSQMDMAKNMKKAVSSGKISAVKVAEMTFDCIRNDEFYCLPHKRILGAVVLRMQDILASRNPTDAFGYNPKPLQYVQDVGKAFWAALTAARRK